jgi:hypothetical protein
MAKSIRQLISKGDDQDLFVEVSKRLIDCYGDQSDISCLPADQRIILFVSNALGSIGNGGFNCLFESSLKGDPHFQLCAEAFRRLECAEAATAFQRALDLFPDSKPPADVGERLKIYRHGSGELRNEIDKQFWKASESIEQRAAAFIRANAESFNSLDSVSYDTEPRKKTVPPLESSRPRTAVGQLPHWARVMFAARCARHVEPLFEVNWPGAAPQRRDSLSRVISLAEYSAAEGRPADGLAAALDDVIETGGTAMFAIYGHPKQLKEACPPDGNMASLVSVVVRAARYAGEAALAGPERSEGLALEAYSDATEAVGGNKAAINQMQSDWKLLLQVAAKAGWNDSTPVPVDVFKSAPIRSKGNKPWWKFW